MPAIFIQAALAVAVFFALQYCLRRFYAQA